MSRWHQAVGARSIKLLHGGRQLKALCRRAGIDFRRPSDGWDGLREIYHIEAALIDLELRQRARAALHRMDLGLPSGWWPP